MVYFMQRYPSSYFWKPITDVSIEENALGEKVLCLTTNLWSSQNIKIERYFVRNLLSSLATQTIFAY